MTQAQVTAVWGNPLQTQVIADKTIWKYTLKQTDKSPIAPPIAYYLIFAGDPPSLKGWYTD
jgi:hypothetical protein